MFKTVTQALQTSRQHPFFCYTCPTMKKKTLAYKPGSFEKTAWKKNQLVCGIDEAGRGPLAGPLVVGAVIIPHATKYKLLQDSKILTNKELLLAYQWIIKNCLYTYIICSHETIDKVNIYQATLASMRQSFLSLMAKYTTISNLTHVLVDAMPLTLPKKYNSLKIAHFNYGESISPSIAAASIIAKVTRDQIMHELDTIFPGYNFTQHKGYGTKAHTQTLHNMGPSLIHRKTFIKKLTRSNNDKRTQQSIFS